MQSVVRAVIQTGFMTLALVNYREQARDAIQVFWRHKTAAQRLDGFASLVRQLVASNGLPNAQVHTQQALTVLPGYFRPSKRWDLLVMNGRRLVAALEFRSQTGSLDAGYDRCTEEAIASAHCLWTAYREGALGNQPRPFLGWLMVAEDTPGARVALADEAPHFQLLREFQGASFLRRYDLLCQKLVKEQLYSAATLLATPATAQATGDYAELSQLSGLENLVTGLAGHVAAEAARTAPP